MNALTEVKQGGAVAVQGEYDPYAAYGQEAANGGAFLKFNRGEWLLGQDAQTDHIGKLLVANMEELSIGWIRWEGGKPVERRMNLLLSGIRPEPRDALGYTDQELWETDDEGKATDPWTKTNELPMADPETGEQMTFSASSKGAIGCIGNLCKAYAKERMQHVGEVPVLELSRDSYMHPVYKKTYVPVLNIVDWIENGRVPTPAAASDDDDAPAAQAVAEKAAAKPATASKTRF